MILFVAKRFGLRGKTKASDFTNAACAVKTRTRNIDFGSPERQIFEIFLPKNDEMHRIRVFIVT